MGIEGVKVKECSYCGHTEFGEGVQQAQGNITMVFLKVDQKLYHTVCLNCGIVVRSYVKKPEKFKR